LLFAAVSVYWAAGGTVGASTQMVSIERLAEERDRQFVTVLWLSAALKLSGALLALALVRPWGAFLPSRLLLITAWLGGVCGVLYGGAGIVVDALRAAGVVALPDPADAGRIYWHLLLWDPWWALGGALFCLAAHHCQRIGRRPHAISRE